MSETEFVNKVFDVCANLGKEDVHFTTENGQRTWDDTLHNVIQSACVCILNAFEKFEEEEL